MRQAENRAQLIRKVHEVDFLEGPETSLRVIALIGGSVVMRGILPDLGRRKSEAPGAWPARASLALTYHPVPDIA